jgi:hypothetical protein
MPSCGLMVQKQRWHPKLPNLNPQNLTFSEMVKPYYIGVSISWKSLSAFLLGEFKEIKNVKKVSF